MTNAGNGTIVSIYAWTGGTSDLLYSSLLAPDSYGASSGFGTLTVTLAAGDFLDFAVNNNGGDYYYDGTGISGTIRSAVPEPASWALMLGGFGLVGGALRRRKQAIAFG